MNQFDQTTDRLMEEAIKQGCDFAERLSRRTGRNSTKTSLEALAQAVEFYRWDGQIKPDNGERADQAIAIVKANGDWPLEEDEPLGEE